MLENINEMPKYIGTDFNIMGQGKVASIFSEIGHLAFLENSTESRYLTKNNTERSALSLVRLRCSCAASVAWGVWRCACRPGAGVDRRCAQYLRKRRLVHSLTEPLTHCVYVERFYFQVRNSRHIFCKREVLCAKYHT